MTNGVQEDNVNLTNPVSDVQANAPAPAAAAVEEKMIPQHQVNEIVGNAKQRGYEKALREIQAQQEKLNAQPAQNSPQQANTGQQDIGALIDQRLNEFQQKQTNQHQEQLAQSEANRILSELEAKSADAKTRYSDFDEKLTSVGYFNFAPEVLHFANNVDNSGDVMYDLASNPTKIMEISALAQKAPQLAALEIQKLSNSIKQNQLAQQSNHSPEPLRQVRSSNVGTDNGREGLKDFKARFTG